MELVTKMFICARESVVGSKRGQTMTEYALIIAACEWRYRKRTNGWRCVCLSSPNYGRLFSCARTFWARSSAFARGFSPSNVR